MGPLGADPEALHELAVALRTASARLDDITVGLDRRSRATAWHGPDAERFEREWHGQHRPTLRRLGDSCSRLAVTLRAQAEQQTRASAADSTTLDSTPAPSRPGRSLTETVYMGGIEIKAGYFNGMIRGDVSIRELGGGRTRVTVTETALAGVVASVGARLEFSIGDDAGTVTPAHGARAEGKVRGGGTLRRSWEVDEDEVTGLLARLAADEALTLAAGGSSRLENPLRERTVGGDSAGSAARWFGGVIDDGFEWFTGIDPGVDDAADRLVTIPAADRAEALMTLEAVGGAGAAAGSVASRAAPAAYIQASGTWSVGVGRWDGGRSLILENQAEGSAGASIGLLRRLGLGLPDNLHAATDLRLELAQRNDGTIDHVLIQLATTINGEQTESSVELDLTGDFARDASAGFRRLADRASDLDLEGTVGALLSLATVDLPLDELEVSTTTGEVSGTTSRIGASVGKGLTIGLAGHGQVERIERPA